MQLLNLWLQGIVVAVIIATIIEMIMPNGNNKKYIKVVLGVYVLFNIMAPIINKFSGDKFELSAIMNMEEYTKKIEEYNTNNINSNVEKSNGENIKQIYIANLKNSIKAKLQEKKYEVNKIEIKIDNAENYNIEEISIYLSDKDSKTEEKENGNQVKNRIKINEVEKVEIRIGENKVKVDESEKMEKVNQVDKKIKKEIKEYLASVYEINEQKINIY